MVIIDSCYSGGFIGKGGDIDEFSDRALKIFNEGIIKAFFSGQNRERDLLTADCYQVLTSCTSNQICFPINSDGNTMGAFTAALIKGCGYYNNDFPADLNSNGEITLEEAYFYVKDEISSWGIIQDVQVYPTNSTFVFAGY